MKNFNLKVLLILGCFATAALSSCMFTCVEGSGKSATEQRKVDNFIKLDISGACKVILKQDSSLSLQVSADDNLLKYIHTSVSGDKLRIYNRKNFCNSSPVVITIGIKNLSEIRTSGAVEVEGEGKIITKDLAFKLTGASNIDLELDASRVFTDGSGATTVKLKGQASSHTVELTGSGKVYAFDFVVGNYNIRSSGASHCQINVLHELDVNSTGASDVEYKGNPAVVNNQKAGASSLNKVD